MPSCNYELSAQQQRIILDYACAAAAYAAKTGRVLSIDKGALSGKLVEPGACFVTLKLFGKLRGCTGSIEAYRALIVDVVNNAYSSALHDRRFKPLSTGELTHLTVSVSVLTPRTAIKHSSEANLLEQLRPGTDGLTIETDQHRAVFLPIMWQQLPQPTEFLRQLKLKAGLPADYWSEQIEATRFEALLIGRDE